MRPAAVRFRDRGDHPLRGNGGVLWDAGAAQMHRAGMAQGYTQNDAASLFEVYLKLAGDPDALPPQKPVI